MQESSIFDGGSKPNFWMHQDTVILTSMPRSFYDSHFSNNELELQNSFQNGNVFFFKNLPALYVGWGL